MASTHPTANSFIRDFWRGLTTPCPGVLKLAALFLLLLLGAVALKARHFRQQVEAGAVPWQSFEDDFSRSSIMAVRGASRETDASAKTLVFVGPSSLRCWLPHPDDTAGIASSAAGTPVKVLSMCANKQSYSFTSALIDRFGSDFDGWFVIGVGMHLIGREYVQEDHDFHRRESRVLGFSSGILRKGSGWMGDPQERETGLEAWDRRAFFYQCKLGMERPASGKAPYFPYLPARPIPSDPVAADMPSFSGNMLNLHLVLLQETAERIHKAGRAKLALVETPWVDSFTPSMQTAQWRMDEATYQSKMAAWSEANGVTWISTPNHLQATAADFSDTRHLGSADLRRHFLETVTRELLTR
ncbi:hypothetical protein KBB96_00490 [Luteolibacter ambystomatis]|uniref:Uncharacterized protein n=1 Tax=Luteolibacter ambystomatis TaxID=2824561 RepID=A0A975IZE7_9BACT|nr:hypothetical protein [Luteolibacter ambystomatis]QUE51391.1 hypothetical protein KBB96_00490 [Luteolibacter ambystomatis]